MSAFAAMLKAAMKQRLQYRAAALAGVFTQLVFGMIYNMVYLAFFESGTGSVGMTAAQTVSYVWLGQAVYRMMAWSGDKDIEAMMRDGRIAFELARPVDIFPMWFARSVAMRTAPLLLNTPLIVLIALVLPAPYRMTLDLAYLLPGVLSMLLALLVSAAMTTILTATYFWTISGQGINRILPMVGSLCAGHIVPLQFFPEGARMFLRMLPFASMLDAPQRILIGAVGWGEIPLLLGIQVFWLAALSVLCWGILRRGVRKCMVQGG